VAEEGRSENEGAQLVNPAANAAVLTVKFRQPSHEFTIGVGMNFISYPLVLTPVVLKGS
jgi:hypothetical protein